MRIFVTAKAAAKHIKIEVLDEQHLKVSVREKPKEGRANVAIMDALADHFHVSIARVRLVSGFSSTHKVFDIAL